MTARPPSFRLGSTSYVYRAGLVENAERLAGTVDDIELVLFDVPDGPSNLPDAATVSRLARIGAAHGLTYTVHLPLDLRAPPHRSFTLARRIIALTEPLTPWAIVFHLDGTGVGTPAWTKQAVSAVRALAALVSAPQRLALENLETYAPEHLLPVFEDVPVARALDVGHLWKAGRDPLTMLDAWLPFSRVVHLHGVNGRDHQPLSVMPPARLDPVMQRLRGWAGVLTLEVFEDDFFVSHAAFMESLARVAADGER